MPEADAAVEVMNVQKRFGRTLALADVSFRVLADERFALLGPNGAGKTTLVDILCTIRKPDSGSAKIAGIDVVAQPLRARRRLGVVFQVPSLDDRLTVLENLYFHGLVYGVPARQRRQRIDALLELVELSDWRGSLVRALSSGMKRRLEIARALVHDASVLVLDEPTVGLDALSRERIWQYLDRLQRERSLTIVVTTHYIEEVEDCDRVCIIDHGEVLAIDTPAHLKIAHGQELLRITPRDAATRVAILERFADRVVGSASHAGRQAPKVDGGVRAPGAEDEQDRADVLGLGDSEIVLRSDGDEFVGAFLADFGTRVSSLHADKPSLESVFLSLTGRALRDRAAGDRERTYAFGRQGGEHTR